MATKRAFSALVVILVFWSSVASVVLEILNVSSSSPKQAFYPHSIRPVTTQRRIFAPLRQQQVKWTKHGYTCYSPPDLHRDIDLTIYMDISLNPGPERWSDSLRALYLNARSVKAFVTSEGFANKICKITLLQQLVYSGDFDVVCICETWLNRTVLDSEIIPEYSIFRLDRKDRTGGGVLIAVKADIHALRRPDLERGGAELVVVEIRKGQGKPVLIYCFYHPDTVPESLIDLNYSLQTNCESSCIVLVGDFNLPELDWSEDQCTPVNIGSRADHNVFCDQIMGDNFFQQFIPGPTHIAGNKLDLLLSNCPEIIDGVSTFHPRDGKFPSDHYVVEFKIRLKFKRATAAKRQVFDYKNGNFNDLRESLGRVPFDIVASDDIDEHWSNWKDLFLTAVKAHIPVKTVYDKNSPSWIDGEVRHLIRKKYAALRQFRKTKTPERKQKLRNLSQQVKILVREKHRQYLAKIETSLKDNPKLFWNYHKAFLRGRIGANPIISFMGDTAVKAAEKAELFNKFFSSVFRAAAPDVNNDFDLINITNMEISHIEVSVDEVREYLKALNSNKAGGPDGIPSRLLKECCDQIAPSLCAIFNQSLRSGRIPSEWKSADITPIHKKDLKEPAENYRPISLLPIISKVLERCVLSRLYEHLSHSITEIQHGFLKNRSCVTQLLSVLHIIGQYLDKNIQTDLIYLDFAKAFDSVDHKILLAKLNAYGVSGQLLDWFTDYLTGRVQRVVVDGAASQWTPVTSGVPQGSLLGPLLFTIFINDLPNVVEGGAMVALYADDTKIYRSITSAYDCIALQNTLSRLDEWTKRNNICFNASKCKALTVTRKRNPLTHNYSLNQVRLEHVSEEKDLGVIITSTLSWDKHVYVIVAKANKLLGLLKRSCPLLTDVTVRRTLYLSLVKSQLCFGTQVWSPTQFCLKEKIERVQRRATRWILRTRRGEISYKERLVTLDLLPLAYDREQKDLVFFYNCLHGNTDLNVYNFVTLISHGRTKQSNSLNLRTPLCKTSSFQGSYFNRIVKLWNFIHTLATESVFSSSKSFQHFVHQRMVNLLHSTFDPDRSCTWSLVRTCSCHRASGH